MRNEAEDVMNLLKRQRARVRRYEIMADALENSLPTLPTGRRTEAARKLEEVRIRLRLAGKTKDELTQEAARRIGGVYDEKARRTLECVCLDEMKPDEVMYYLKISRASFYRYLKRGMEAAYAD